MTKNPTDLIHSSVEHGKGWNFYTNLILFSKTARNSPWSDVSAVNCL